MRGKIEVDDTFIPDDLLDECTKVFETGGFRYGWHSHKNVEFRHWHHEVLGAENNNKKNQEHVLLGLDGYEPIKALWKQLQNRIYDNKAELLRCYANLHTFGVEGYPHRDSSRTDETTIIFYLNREWEPIWGGETAFYRNNEIIRSVLPKFGRMVSFPSQMLHAARNVTRLCSRSRTTLMYKVRGNQEIMPDQRFIEYLTQKGAGEASHSGRTLLVHLCGTYDLLKKQGEREAVCLAGLFHSVYGTTAYQHVTVPLEQRQEVRSLIGIEAEQIVFEFCSLDRPSCFLTGQLRNRDLLAIEIANLQEQGSTKFLPAYQFMIEKASAES